MIDFKYILIYFRIKGIFSRIVKHFQDIFNNF